MRGEAEVSQTPSEEEMTHRADLPCRGLRPSLAENCRKRKGAREKTVCRGLVANLLFFQDLMDLSWPVSVLGGARRCLLAKSGPFLRG